MTLLTLLLLLCIVYLVSRIQFLLRAQRDDLEDVRRQLTQLSALHKATQQPDDRPRPSTAPASKDNINTISKNGLRAIPKVGAACAQKVIDGRPYQSLSQLDHLPGISEAQRAALKQHLAV